MKHVGLRAQKPESAQLVREPGVLEEPVPQGWLRGSAEPGPQRPCLRWARRDLAADESLDATVLAFLTARALEARKKEREAKQREEQRAVQERAQGPSRRKRKKRRKKLPKASSSRSLPARAAPTRRSGRALVSGSLCSVSRCRLEEYRMLRFFWEVPYSAPCMVRLWILFIRPVEAFGSVSQFST